METLEATAPTPVVQTSTNEFVQYESAVKRAFDLCLAVIALACVFPLLLVAMLAIILETPGSPIFTQARVGQNGKIFRIFKLRTMVAGSDKQSFRTQQMDKRLTRVGAILRRLNIDELPQLVNILLGHMSIIGPRPLSLDETRFLTTQAGFEWDYPGLIPTSRPGLVGLEQVNRDRELSYAERFRYNHNYESNWTVVLDLNILAKAILLCSPVCVAVVGGGAVLLYGLLVH